MIEKPQPKPLTQTPTVSPYVYPLDEFYARAGLPLPAIEVISGDEMPEPYRSLLVHKNDMTPTLENYHRSAIHLEILRSEPRGDFYFREVVLRLDREEIPVEFGANKINLTLYSPEVRQLILKERLPLGHILKVEKVPHHTCAKAYLKLRSDEFIDRAFGLPEPCTLYGRRATIWDPQERPISEIVEILPPVSID